MDVTRSPIPGMMPHLRGRPLLTDVPVASGGGSDGVTASLHAFGAAASGEVAGEPDGADILLPSGIRLRKRQLGATRVSDTELMQVVRAVQLLPLQHQLLIARAGVAISLVPVDRLEQVPGTTQAVLGATAVNQSSGGTWAPSQIRVATRSPLSTRGGVNAIGEVAQHEIGHAIAVLAAQDRSEDAAIRYAARY